MNLICLYGFKMLIDKKLYRNLDIDKLLESKSSQKSFKYIYW